MISATSGSESTSGFWSISLCVLDRAYVPLSPLEAIVTFSSLW